MCHFGAPSKASKERFEPGDGQAKTRRKLALRQVETSNAKSRRKLALRLFDISTVHCKRAVRTTITPLAGITRAGT
jgi:hypothetical protein